MKWISVKDKLPPVGDNILAYGVVLVGRKVNGQNFENTVDCAYVMKDGNGKYLYRIELECCNEGLFFEKVSHWMPLPSPPNEDHKRKT